MAFRSWPRRGLVDRRPGAANNERVSLEVFRLHLASLQGTDGRRWPAHGLVVTHPGGAVLVDTGVGGPRQMLETGAWSTARSRMRWPTWT